MIQSPQQLLVQALQLPPADRGQLVVLLIDSLEQGAEMGTDQAWSSEVEDRLQQIDEGRVTMIPWSEARRQIRGLDGTLSD